MKKMKLSCKAVLSLVLSAVLFCMPALGFAMNGNYAMSVHAEDMEFESGSEEKSTENDTERERESGSEENSTEEDTVSDDDAKEPECTCEDKCGSYEYDHNCEVCVQDYKACAYKKPNVTIQINQPDGWHNDKAMVKFIVADVAHTGNFETARIQAKVGQNGSWTNVTEDRKLEISENCTVYVQVTDQKGNTYERSRAIRCFDTIKPTLNAAVSDGLLSIQVHDTDSGAKAVYVNGYEFTELTNGVLNIRLQQFDAGYQYFTIYAMDNAGNMSEVYKTANPYYTDPEAKDSNESNPAKQLPIRAEATKPSSATGQVTEHTKTDSDGNTTVETGIAEQSERGKEFYTIQTASDKVFYLIIDRNGEEEMVYFLTEITENDLLNTTFDNSEILPKNSAALESAIPISENALPNNNAEQENKQEKAAEDTESTDEPSEAEVLEQENPMLSYILIGGLAVIVIGGAYYFKVVRKKKEGFIEDEDEDEEDNEEYENEDEESEVSSEDDFFEEQEEK